MGLKAMNLNGKEYVTVNVRVQEFRSNDLYKGYSLDTDILSETEDKITMKATMRGVEALFDFCLKEMSRRSPKKIPQIDLSTIHPDLHHLFTNQ